MAGGLLRGVVAYWIQSTSRKLDYNLIGDIVKTLYKPTTLGLTMIFIIAMLAGISPRASAGSPPQVKTDPQVVARLAQVLERSGYAYKKAADNVWVVTFKGNFKIFVTSAENLIIMGAVVEPKSSMKVGPELMFKLLRLTHDIDRVKIGFD